MKESFCFLFPPTFHFTFSDFDKCYNLNTFVFHRSIKMTRKWEEMVHCYQTCIAQNVCISSKTDKELFRWVTNQRQQYQLHLKGLKSSLTEERITALNKIGFTWTVYKNWDSNFQELVKCYNLGETAFSHRKGEHKPLAEWVKQQRKLFVEAPTSTLQLDKMNKLLRINFLLLNKNLWKSVVEYLKTNALVMCLEGHHLLTLTIQQQHMFCLWTYMMELLRSYERNVNNVIDGEQAEGLKICTNI